MNISGFSINQVLWDSLRNCQKESIRIALSYLKKPLDESANSCLISLPTGAGKSGVISVLSHKATQKRVLVLCHRRAVCDQLIKDISGKFFIDRAENEDIPLKLVFSSFTFSALFIRTDTSSFPRSSFTPWACSGASITFSRYCFPK